MKPQLSQLGYGQSRYGARDKLDQSVLKIFKTVAWNLNEFAMRSTDGYRQASDWAVVPAARDFADGRVRTEAELQAIKNVLLEQDADVILLAEVADLASIRKFAMHENYLNGHWDLMIHPSNQYGSSIGYLVKRGLPLNIEFETHIHAKRINSKGREIQVFTRDVPALIIKPTANPRDVVIFLGVHAKSMRDSPEWDPDNVKIRTKEFLGIEQIKAVYRSQYLGAKFVVLGDMNTESRQAGEMDILKKNAVSFLDLAGVPVNDDRRVTHTYHEVDQETHKSMGTKKRQMDDILVDKSLISYFLAGYVLRYKDEAGREKPLPQTQQERNQNLSDHFPIVGIFDLYKLFFGPTLH